MDILSFLPLLLILAFLIFSAFRILNEYERGVIFRLGRYVATKGPGLIILIPFLDKMVRTSLRTVAMDVPHQDVITKDNVSIKVNAVIYFRVVEPSKSVLQIEDYLFATSQLSQTTLRSVCGAVELDEVLSRRDEINAQVQSILDQQTDIWGVKVSGVELKHVDLPAEMQRAMAKQAEAERERRAKIISAEAEFQAAEKLTQAAEIIARSPEALTLRYLQTMREMASASQATILPIPLDIFRLKN